MRRLLLPILVGLMLILVGCGSSDTSPLTTPFVGGKNALILSFAPSAPPSTVFDSGQFPFGVIINVENRGEYDLKDGDGYIVLDSIHAENFGVSSQDLMQDIPAIQGTVKNFQGTVTPGFRDIVSFDQLNYQPDLRGDLSVSIRAAACYNYQTYTTTNICIKQDAVDNFQEREVCRIAEDKRVHNSGGTIHITQMTQMPKGRDAIQVTFVVSHVGEPGALFFREGAACDLRVNNPERYQVFVEVEPIVGGTIMPQCTGFQQGALNAGYITLFEKQPRTITCSFDTANVASNFVEPLNINLRYRYWQAIETPLLIKDVTTE